MNTVFDNNENTDFELAVRLSDSKFSHKEILNMLTNGNIAEKQIAALNITKINNKTEGKLLVNNLIGCDGKIREAVALKINQLLCNDNSLSEYLLYPNIFAKATIDINANICRMVIESIKILKNNSEFGKIYSNEIIKFIQEAYAELDKIIYKDKKYTINKQLFKLYWCLEALKLFAKEIDENTLLPILTRASKEREYTIREKAAQIIIQLESNMFYAMKTDLKNDENYYVRAVFRI